MPGTKRKVKSYVLADGNDLHEFDTVEEALALAGSALSEELSGVVDEQSTVFIIVRPGDPEPGDLPPGPLPPEGHRHLLPLAGLAFAYTYSSRDPVLAVDVREDVLLIVAKAEKIEAFLAGQGYQVPLSTPHPNKWARWVVTIARDKTCARNPLVMEPRPGIGQA